MIMIMMVMIMTMMITTITTRANVHKIHMYGSSWK